MEGVILRGNFEGGSETGQGGGVEKMEEKEKKAKLIKLEKEKKRREAIEKSISIMKERATKIKNTKSH